MQIEQKKMTQQHIVSMENRQKMTITGVLDVASFSDTAVDLKTSMGGMIIKGKGLSISKLSTDSGELNVNGEIAMMQYTQKSGGGFFAGLFK